MAKTSKPAHRPRRAASARRAQLVEVGRMVFAGRGYEAASVEEVAERADISKPIVYEHFGAKEGLYAVIVDREVDYLVTRIVEAISTGSPRYAHALVGVVAFVGQWWTESRKPPPVERVAGHITALAWMGLRPLPRRPVLLAGRSS